MNILCDTCGILMLIRIAPEMFLDERYECLLLPSVVSEIFNTSRFKSKYPWRKDYREKMRAIPASAKDDDVYSQFRAVVEQLHASGIVDKRTDRLFSLSRVDREIVAFALAGGMRILTGDNGIVRFAAQEFADDFAGAVSALQLVNDWLERALIENDDRLYAILEEWSLIEEAPQPRREARRFRALTGRSYPGP